MVSRNTLHYIGDKERGLNRHMARQKRGEKRVQNACASCSLKVIESYLFHCAHGGEEMTAWLVRLERVGGKNNTWPSHDVATGMMAKCKTAVTRYADK